MKYRETYIKKIWIINWKEYKKNVGKKTEKVHVIL